MQRARAPVVRITIAKPRALENIPSAGPDDGADRYEIERPLGEGASGAVFLVRDRQTGEQLALKRLQRADKRSIARLKRESRSQLVDGS